MGTAKSFDVLDASDTAALLCLTKRQLQNLVDLGLPKHGSGKGSYYSWPEVFQWYIGYKLDQNRSKEALNRADPNVVVDGENFSQALCRKMKAEAHLKELDLALRRGEVVAIADVERNIADVSIAVKTKLLALPSKMVSALVALKTKQQMQAALDSEMRQICEELINAGDSGV